MSKKDRISLDMEFADGVVRTVKPLKIAQLREFIKATKDLTSAEDLTDKDIDKMMNAAAIIVKGFDAELAADRKKLEDAIDVDIFWTLVSVAMGNRVEGNPNE